MKMSIVFTICRVIVSLLLFWAIANHSYSYYSFLKFAVFLTGIWGLVKAVNEKEISLMLFHLILMAIFYPFSSWRFEKESWVLIDVLAGFFLLISIFILDSDPIDNFLDSSIGKKLVSIFSILFGIGFILFGAFLIYNSTFQMINSLKLKSNGVETVGYLSRVEHQIEADENEQGDVSFDEFFNVDYTFETSDGVTYKGSSQISDSPTEELKKISDKNTYVPKDKKELPINVMYESENPQNNRVVSDRNGFSNDVISFVVITLFSLIPLFVGIKTCKQNLKILLYNKLNKA